MVHRLQSSATTALLPSIPSRLQSGLLRLHGTMEFGALWSAVQELFESFVPHDTLVMSANYFDWRREASARRLTSARSRVMDDSGLTQLVAAEGRQFFQPFLDQHPRIPCYRHTEVIADPRRMPATRYYRRFMAPLGWRYSAHLLFWQQNGVETSLALRRRADQGDFTAEEMEAMQAVHPHLAVALARVQAFERESERRRLLESFYRFKPEAVLFLNWNLDVLYASHEAMVLCADWNLGATHARAYAPQAVFSPPPELLAGCETLKSEWGRRQTANPEQKSALTLPTRSERHGGEAAITLQCADRGAEGRPVFVIRLRPAQAGPDGKCTAVERQRLLGLLTPGERELAELVSAGLSNKEVADRVNKTVGSVKVQLSGVFQKLRVSSRTQLALRLSVGSASCP